MDHILEARLKKVWSIVHNFKIDKLYWTKDALTGEECTSVRSKPAPFIKTAIEIFKALRLKTVVEIGSTRYAVSPKCIEYMKTCEENAYVAPPCCCDGHSTYFWAEAGFDTHTVDIDENCRTQIEWSFQNLQIPRFNNINVYIPQDGIEFFSKYKIREIDVLFLDGWDKGTPEYAQRHLDAYKAAQPYLSPDIHCVLIDDTDFKTADGGKDHLLTPYLLDNNYIPLFNGRQSLFIKYAS